MRWSVKHWYLYLISIAVCVAAGYYYYAKTPASYKVSASLMLRTPSDETAQGQLLRIMGGTAAANSADEIEQFTSSTLLNEVVTQLNLRTQYYVRRGLQWQNIYPDYPFTMTFPSECKTNLKLTLTVKDGHYTLRLKDGSGEVSTVQVTDLRHPIATHIGDVQVTANRPLADGKYRIRHMQQDWAVVWLQQSIAVNRSSRESNIIHLSCSTQKPAMMRDVMKAMLQQYADRSVGDKTVLAAATEQFLQTRLRDVAQQLAQTETAIEEYKQRNGIANLQNAAENYRSYADQYEREIAKLDADIEVLDFITQCLNRANNDYTVLPGETGISDRTLTELIRTYNAQVMERERLLLSASADNPTVQMQTEKVRHTRKNLTNAIEQCRQSTLLIRSSSKAQYDLYRSRLKALPEVEHRYTELLREKSAQEKQYLYLAERQEENALLLAADAMPVNVVEQPMIYPDRVAPKKSYILLVMLLLGMAIPFGGFILFKEFGSVFFERTTKQPEL